MPEPSRVMALGALAFLGMVAMLFASPSTLPKAMAMPKKAFETHSKDIKMETTELALTLKLKPGMTLGEVGGGNGTLLINMLPKVMPSGKYYGTGADDIEVSAMKDAAAKAGFADAVSVQVAGKYTSGLPEGCCDVIYLRMVYHMLQQPEEYLADFKKSLKPHGQVQGQLFTLSHMGTNHSHPPT